MAGENIRDEFSAASNLARRLANDRSFVSEIGLDECPPDMVVPALTQIFGFILGMYNSAKSIFASYRSLTLDEKFVRLLYSRFILMPWWPEKPSEAMDYTKDAYEDIKWGADRCKCKWRDMSLYAKFFEVCAHVLFEDMIAVMKMVGEPKWDTGADTKLVTRPVLAVAFDGIFTEIKWELDALEKKGSGIPCRGCRKWKSKNTTDDWIIKPELAFIYMIHKRIIRDKRKQATKRWSTSPEEDFWITFIELTWHTTWNNKSQIEVNLSEVLRLYLRIYREDIRAEMTAEEEPEFLKILKERLYKASQAFESPVDVAWLKTNPCWRLAQVVFGKDTTTMDRDTPIAKQIGVGATVLMAMNSLAGAIPMKLVKDI